MSNNFRSFSTNTRCEPYSYWYDTTLIRNICWRIITVFKTLSSLLLPQPVSVPALKKRCVRKPFISIKRDSIMKRSRKYRINLKDVPGTLKRCYMQMTSGASLTVSCRRGVSCWLLLMFCKDVLKWGPHCSTLFMPPAFFSGVRFLIWGVLQGRWF